MPGDFSIDFSGMTDDELYDVVLEHLRDHPMLDAGWIDVQVADGHVTLGGRVGTDAEKQVAEKVVVELMGVDRFSNDLVVDELTRQTLPEAIDEELAEEREMVDPFGGPPPQHSDTAAHLVEDLGTQTYGTSDIGEAVQDGTSYSPPSRPVADGYGSEEAH